MTFFERAGAWFAGIAMAFSIVVLTLGFVFPEFLRWLMGDI